jgi:phenylacetate-coenzyme A ligase PaaK-like adenylate-forming protein
MLIYKGMNVFPTAVRDLIVQAFSDQIEPMIRIWKDHKEQVRFDDALPVDVEVLSHFDRSQAAQLAADIEQAVRAQLQVRISIRVLGPGDLPRGVYKNSILAVRGT